MFVNWHVIYFSGNWQNTSNTQARHRYHWWTWSKEPIVGVVDLAFIQQGQQVHWRQGSVEPWDHEEHKLVRMVNVLWVARWLEPRCKVVTVWDWQVSKDCFLGHSRGVTYTTCHYTTLHFTIVHYITLHCTTLHFIPWYYITPQGHLHTRSLGTRLSAS